MRNTSGTQFQRGGGSAIERTDDLGERTVVALDLAGNVAATDEGGAEEDEGVRGTRDV